MKESKTLNMARGETRPGADAAKTAQAQANLQRALNSSARLKDFVENRPGRLFSETKKG